MNELTGCEQALMSAKEIDNIFRNKMPVLEIAKEVEAQSREFCPVDTGYLRDSHETVRINNNTAEIRVKADYAAFVEMGTWKQDAQPYLRPAVDKVVKETNFQGKLQLLVNRVKR